MSSFSDREKEDMLEIHALTYNDLPSDISISGRIPKEGGTMGRSPNNVFVLPDPAKTVSRTHLDFTPYSGNTCQVINVSKLIPVIINRQLLNPGQKKVLKDGDKIMIGSYVLEARFTDTAEAPVAAESKKDLPQRPEPDPFSWTMSEAPPTAPEPNDDPLSPQRGSRRELLQAFDDDGIELESLVGEEDRLINAESQDAEISELFQDPLDDEDCLDPLALLGGDNDDGGDLGDILLTDKPDKRAKPVDMSVSHGSEFSGLFHVPQMKKPRTDAKAVPPSDARAAGKAEADLDRFLIDTGPGSGAPPDKPPVSRPVSRPVVKNDEKPLPVLRQEARVKDSITDEVVRVKDSITDEVVPAKPKTAPRVASRKAKPATAILPKVVPTQSVPPPPSAQEQPKAAAARKGKRTKASQAASPIAEELYAALIEGLGIGELPNRNALDPDFMRLIGQLLHSYAQGTVSLISSRAVIKQEVRASVTLVAPKGNNPLKFSPDAKVALLHMFGQRFPGFLEPLESVQQAFVDLYAHQAGIVSGMQSALNHVLDRFDPEMIEEEMPQRFPGQFFEIWRKAELWDAYKRYYYKTRTSAADHFQSFFGAAFLAAYERVIAEQTDDEDGP